MIKTTIIASFSVVFTLLAGQTAQAIPVIAFEWTEGGPGNGTNSIHQSRHGVNGPVLADDFIAAASGKVIQVDWWGTAAQSNQFEITFHNDAGGVPAATPPSGGIDQQFVTSAGVDPDGDGVFFFSSPWQVLPTSLSLTSGNHYWFSVANFNFGWNWANAGAGGPTVGAESFTGVVSTGVGPNGGPHFGPWNPVLQPTGAKQDFAFRIWVDSAVPEPSILALLGIGLAGFGFTRKRKQLKT